MTKRSKVRVAVVETMTKQRKVRVATIFSEDKTFLEYINVRQRKDNINGKIIVYFRVSYRRTSRQNL